MNFYTVRDLRTHPREIWEKLSEVHEVIITNNGKPSALMIEIDDDDDDDEDDKKFYEVAKSANAFMVTGNTKHFPQEPEVVTPLRFI